MGAGFSGEGCSGDGDGAFGGVGIGKGVVVRDTIAEGVRKCCGGKGDNGSGQVAALEQEKEESAWHEGRGGHSSNCGRASLE